MQTVLFLQMYSPNIGSFCPQDEGPKSSSEEFLRKIRGKKNADITLGVVVLSQKESMQIFQFYLFGWKI